MPKSRYRLPCPFCGSPENRGLGITGLVGDGPQTALLRRYRCPGCGKRWESFEMSNEPMDDTPPFEWLIWEPEPE